MGSTPADQTDCYAPELQDCDEAPQAACEARALPTKVCETFGLSPNDSVEEVHRPANEPPLSRRLC